MTPSHPGSGAGRHGRWLEGAACHQGVEGRFTNKPRPRRSLRRRWLTGPWLCRQGGRPRIPSATACLDGGQLPRLTCALPRSSKVGLHENSNGGRKAGDEGAPHTEGPPLGTPTVGGGNPSAPSCSLHRWTLVKPAAQTLSSKGGRWAPVLRATRASSLSTCILVTLQ